MSVSDRAPTIPRGEPNARERRAILAVIARLDERAAELERARPRRPVADGQPAFPRRAVDRVRAVLGTEPATALELAARAGLTDVAVRGAARWLVRAGEATEHPRSPREGGCRWSLKARQ